MFKRIPVLFDANAGGGGGNNGTSSNGNESNSADSSDTAGLTFEAWHETLPEEHRTLIESHTKSLKSALDSERGTRKDLEKQLRDLAKKAETGSDAQTQLTGMADSLQKADRKTNFYESAHAAGVKNLKLAFTVAETDEMFDKQGNVNFDEMKKSYPELFAVIKTPPGNAGNGTNGSNNTQTMDDFIREKVKR